MKQLWIFDLDRTLVETNVSYQFCLYLYRQKEYRLSHVAYAALCFFRHHYLRMPFLDFHHKLFNVLLKGISIDVLEKHAIPFMQHMMASSLYAPAAEALLRAQEAGGYTMLLSSSPDFLVSKAAAFLSFDEYKATEYEVDKDRKLCNISSIMHGARKAEALTQAANKLNALPENVFAFSDSILDLPLLLLAGNKVAVRPDKRLKKQSLQQGWKIL